MKSYKEQTLQKIGYNKKYLDFKKRYSKITLMTLNLIREKDKINLIDFAGSFRNTYYNYKEILDEIKDVK